MSARPSILHRDDPSCPPGHREMMFEAKRVGCSNGADCPAPRHSGGAARAVFVASDQRVQFLCALCGPDFAELQGIKCLVPAAA